MSGPGHITADPNTMGSIADKKTEIIDYIRYSLGDQMVDVELDKEHYDMAIKQALIRYRARAEHAEEESYAFLDLVKDTQEYILPKEITQVHAIYRRGLGGLTGGASQFEPFSSGFLNTYMLVAGRVGGLLNYELFVDYQKLTMTMFGGYITFQFNSATKKLIIDRKIPNDTENVLLKVHNYKPDQAILNDHRAYVWIQDYAYSKAKHSLGEAREKFAQIAGPQGGTTLNGTALKTEAKAEMDQLMKDLGQYVDGSTPLTWIIG
jgi:hypothetical protein